MQDPQRGHHVLHLRHGEQAAQPDHLHRDPPGLYRLAQRVELDALAAEHGDVGGTDPVLAAVRPAPPVRRDAGRQPQQLFQPVGHPVGLRRGRLQQRARHPPAAGPVGLRHQAGNLRRLGPQAALDHRGRVQDAPGVAEAGGQRPGLRAAEVGGEPPQVARARAAPAVDRLTGVAHRGHRVAAAEQRPQQDQLGLARVLVLIQQHGLVAAALADAHLGVPLRYPGGERHLVAVVQHLPQPLGLGIPLDHGQQLLPGPLAGQDLLDRGGRAWPAAGHRGGLPGEPLAHLPDVSGTAHVLGQFPGELEHGGAHAARGPLDGVHRAVVGGYHAGRDLPGDGGGDQPHRGLHRLPQRVVGHQPARVGVVRADHRLAGEQVGGEPPPGPRAAGRPAGAGPGRPARPRPSW